MRRPLFTILLNTLCIILAAWNLYIFTQDNHWYSLFVGVLACAVGISGFATLARTG